MPLRTVLPPGGKQRSSTRCLRLAAVIVLCLLSAGCCDLEIVTETLPPATAGSSYSFDMESDCGGDLWFLSEGTLPPGLSFTGDGELSGVPSSAGTFLFTVGLEDFSGDLVFKGFSLSVAPGS